MTILSAQSTKVPGTEIEIMNLLVRDSLQKVLEIGYLNQLEKEGAPLSNIKRVLVTMKILEHTFFNHLGWFSIYYSEGNWSLKEENSNGK